jgi:hypothetical protein
VQIAGGDPIQLPRAAQSGDDLIVSLRPPTESLSTRTPVEAGPFFQIAGGVVLPALSIPSHASVDERGM